MSSNDSSFINPVSRRFLIAGTVSLSAAAIGSHVSMGAETVSDAKNDDDLSATFVRLNGRTDGRPAYWITRGVRYLWTGSRDPTPLYNVDTITVPKFTSLGNGEYAATVLENNYATDLITGKIISSFINPLTDKEEIFSNGALTALLSTDYTLKSNGQKVHKVTDGDKVTGEESARGAVRFQRGFPGEVVVEERVNNVFGKEENGAPRYADLAVHYRTESPKLVKGGISYNKVTKTVVISRHWPYGGGETVYSPQVVGIYHGRKFLTSEEAYAIPGVREIDNLSPGTLKKMADL